MNPNLVKDYALGLGFGVFMIFLAGLVINSGTNSITGYAVMEHSSDDFLLKTGAVKDLEIISKDCNLYPEKVFAEKGDLISLRVRVMDEDAHRITLKQKDITLFARQDEIKRAEFYISEPGEYIIEDSFPCRAKGFHARSTLYVS